MEESKSATRKKAIRGFAAMDRSKQKEIARKGGRAAHEQGVAHEWNSSEARVAGKKGGEARSQRMRSARVETPSE